MLELRAKDRVEANTLDHIVGTYLAQFVKDVAQETLKAGLLAKKRAEDEVTAATGNVPTRQWQIPSTYWLITCRQLSDRFGQYAFAETYLRYGEIS